MRRDLRSGATGQSLADLEELARGVCVDGATASVLIQDQRAAWQQVMKPRLEREAAAADVGPMD
jgi:hypothetical protein